MDKNDEIFLLFCYLCMYFSLVLYWYNRESIEKFGRWYNKRVYSHLSVENESESEYDTDSEHATIEEMLFEDKYLKEVQKMSVVMSLEEIEKMKTACPNDRGLEEEEYMMEIRDRVFEKRHERLKTCFVVECTPVGNVAMYYNKTKSTFEYYSDHTIPYRYLEPVCRKYVKMYQCKELYVDMEEELNNLKEKQEEKKRLETEQIETKSKTETEEIPIENKDTTTKKSVFAKFKGYNKEAGNGRVNSVPSQKNNINTTTVPPTTDENILLKEHANHYTCVGRFSNFNILQKVDKKDVNKNYSLTFSEFKKMQNT